MGEESDSIFNKMRNYTWLILALNTGEQVQTWQYILVAYGHLEALALDVLRLHQGIDAETFWKDSHKLPTLYQAATLLSPHHRVSPETIRTMQAVANLRNSVAHKQLFYGMTTYASYRDKPVFDDQYVMKVSRHPEVYSSGVNEETLELLQTDIERAQMDLNRFRRAAALLRGPHAP
jgi:hypothetical protein